MNLTPKSVVFVDDSPLKREAVKTAFPAMLIIGGNQLLTRSILLRAPETQVAVLTGESRRREEMVRGQIEREKERVTLTRDEFLANLGCKADINEVVSETDPRFPRSFELINKTNQFNTTGQRRTNIEMKSFFDGGGELLTFAVSDKFTTYGLIGVAILIDNRIEQFVMSCRVLGLDIEKAAVAASITRLRASTQSLKFTARLTDTSENSICQNLYLNCGFIRDEMWPETFIYTSPSDPNIPGHLTLTGRIVDFQR